MDSNHPSTSPCKDIFILFQHFEDCLLFWSRDILAIMKIGCVVFPSSARFSFDAIFIPDPLDDLVVVVT